jgi:anti-sigma regulatory factor (Ser/Thr protein kinase)
MSSGGVFPVSDPTHVAVVRRAAQRLAEQFGFSDSRAGRLALVVTELGTNLTKHAQRGEMLLRGEDGAAGTAEIAIEVIAMDRGPGIDDVSLSRRDGFSTSGTAGAGLGAIERQSDLFEIHSSAAGTVMLARVAREAAPPPDSAHRLFAGAVQVNAPEELVCGDDWDVLIDDARVAVMIADGLGHGLQAHDAARAARRTFVKLRDRSPADIVDAIHRDLTATRGAALGVFTADLERGVARYCGLGNVAATIVARDGTRRGLVSMPGTAGLGKPRLQEFQYPFDADAMLVMHSDGIASTWDLASYPGLRLRHPSLVAAVLFRDFGRRRDDATAVVLKERPRA